MNRRRVTVAIAAAGVVAGVAGLGVLAMPAGAGPAPVLPQVDAQSLVESVLTAKPAAFGGTVDVNNSLGIPAIAGLPQLSDGASQVRMWTDGQGKARVSLPTGGSERTIVDDGTTLWSWNSETQTVTKTPHGAEAAKPDMGLGLGLGQDGKPLEPVQLARDVVSEIEKSSVVTVDGTARVANRPAYELVLTPKPTERTVLREVRVAVDSELRMPLRVSLLTNGTDEPAVQVGFSELTVGAQDAALFQFTPSASAKVEEQKLEAPSDQDKADAEKALGEASPQVVGDGWDTVIVAKTPAEALSGVQLPAEDKPEHRGPGASGANPQDLLKQLGKQISGPWGSGTLISTKIGNALLADDGRIALGAVPEQVLTEAIGQVK
ncbi:outer membrane lipoprotein carrier protein LolA [Umezawaea sp. NPDC059074]|uniref:LolA family protein n=1 Tax=Umezawaea sp. NPDC059074 TaxID=3346716 RepID=UPI0036AB086F